MHTSSARKTVVIHAHPHLSMACGQRLRAAVARLQGDEGCIDCRLSAQGQLWGRWVIECAWSTLDAMRASVDDILRPVFEQLIARGLLRSLVIHEQDEVGKE